MKLPNKLINENSPYLLKHAYNEVYWYPWCSEAFDKAKNENKLIFLSVGYSSCHWCHVMENESFSDKEVGFLLNENFVSIKVDREERPDIDSLYMKICNMVRGNGGWPLNVILTPDAVPIYVATYIPKNSVQGRTGLIELLERVKKMWVEQKEMLIQNGNEILQNCSFVNIRELDTQIDIKNESYEHLRSYYDLSYGGFGGSPKFPMPHNLLFLLDYYQETKIKNCLDMVTNTLTNMYKGGIFDHIGGGFSRYSVDQYWLVPHFEKMLYDNALLLHAYTLAFEITCEPIYKSVSEKIIKYVITDLRSESNLFYSAQDASVDGVEGKFYTFKKEEIENILDEESAHIFNKTFGVTETGNFEGQNVLNLIGEFNENIDQDIINKIYQYRKTRYELETDDLVLTSWNSLMIASLAEASRVYNNQEYLKYALLTFDAINKNLKYKNMLFTSYRNGKRAGVGFLDDYACYIYACIKLYQVTLKVNYINFATDLLQTAIDKFFDEEIGCFYLNSEKENLIRRPVESYDGAMPSGNSVMYYNLVYLSNYSEDFNLYCLKNKLYKFMATQNPSLMGFNTFFSYSLCLEDSLSKVVLSVKNKEIEIDYSAIKDFDIVVISDDKDKYPLLNDETTYYVCKGKMCLPPNNSL